MSRGILTTPALRPEQSEVELHWKTQTRVVESDTEMELRRAADGRLRVQQTVRFRVRFGRLSTLRFSIPKSLVALIPAGAGRSAIGITVNGQPVNPQFRHNSTGPFDR